MFECSLEKTWCECSGKILSKEHYFTHPVPDHCNQLGFPHIMAVIRTF